MASSESTVVREEARGRREPWWPPVLVWTVLWALALVGQYLARWADPDKSPHFLDGWVQFDGPEYLSIATQGYQQRQLVWFPLYPTLVGLLDGLLSAPVVSAVLVSSLGGLASAVLYWRWSSDRQMSHGARWGALLVLLLYPYGWFLFGVVYSDAVFLAATLAAFLFLERGRPGWAAALGALATATRPSGFAVVLGLTVLWWERSGVVQGGGPVDGWARRLKMPISLDRSRVGPSALIPLLSMSGLAAHMLYCWIAWGSPLRWMTEQANYHASGRPTLLKQQYFEAWSQGFDGRHLATTTAQAVILVVVLATVPAVGRRFGWGYAVYVLGLCLLPAVSVATFMGTGRYLLPAFPVFALAGAWLEERPRLRAAWILSCTVVVAVMVVGFSRSWYLT